MKRAVDAGARLHLGGGRDGAFFEPTVLTDLDRQSEAAQEEFCGPVAQMYRVASEEEAIELANTTPFGLGAYLRTTDREQAQRVDDQLEVGMIY